ncbi:DUF6074 family protein [Phyllobacterium ifriqiyense]|uniref:DUF6074 family protein n=1 Tax=Phyllobacterium ifriqiyense TaxID=314238 RepID=UPI003391DD98
MNQPSLFDWTPPCRVVPFPLQRRVGKIREVAARSVNKSPSCRERYFDQVAGGLFAALARIEVPETAQDEAVGAFFTAVEQELQRMSLLGKAGGGR